MQCLSCGFENLPGLRTCARCASPLDMAAVAVEPPRAGALRVATRVAQTQAVARRWGLWIPRARSVQEVWRRLLPERLDLRALVWCVIPGMGQMRSGRPLLGRVLLTCWLAVLLLLVVSLGTNWQYFWFAVLPMVHAVGFVEVLAANLCWERLYMRLLFGLGLYWAVFFALYWPAQWSVTRFVNVVPIDSVPGPGILRAGDGLLMAGPWLRSSGFQRGDLVLYRMDALMVDHYYIRAGVVIDRVVGVPGDQVQIGAGKLLINGAPPAAGCGPLYPPEGLAFCVLDLVLPPNVYVILPTSTARGLSEAAVKQMPAVLQAELTLVSYDRIVGRVLWRIRPFQRWGAVE